MKKLSIALAVILATFLIAHPQQSKADQCGPNPEECVAKDDKFYLLSTWGFLTWSFQTSDYGSSYLNPGGPLSGLEEEPIEAGICQIPLIEGLSDIYIDDSPIGVASGTTVLDVVRNLLDAANGFGENISAILPGRGEITLGNLLEPNATRINVISGTLNGESGQTQTLALGSGSVPLRINITIDLNEVNAQAPASGGDFSRELAITILHELLHGRIDSIDNIAGNDPNSTIEDEQAFDVFAEEILDQLEELAEQNGIDLYAERECNEEL